MIMTKRQQAQIRGRIIRAARTKLLQDINAYLRDYEPLVCFTYAEQGYLAIGVEAFLNDGSSAYDALQKVLHPESPSPNDLAPADQEGAAPAPAQPPLIQLVSR